jgi:hypothetical protein
MFVAKINTEQIRRETARLDWAVAYRHNLAKSILAKGEICWDEGRGLRFSSD